MLAMLLPALADKRAVSAIFGMQGFKINKQFKLKREEGAAGDIQTGTIASRTQLRASVKTCIFFKIKRAAGRSRYSIPSHHAL
jgi:hypothetical protein